MKKLNEPGDTVESVFCEVEQTCTTQKTEESDELQDGRSENEEISELEMEMLQVNNLSKSQQKAMSC